MGYFLPLLILDSIKDIDSVVYLKLSLSLIVGPRLIYRMSCNIVSYLTFLAGKI